ncbi:anti-sigma factor [Nocardioides sp. AE5]|uniref:anti-sigma factor n=1 Tax=Nocardioides sp. AE5 TaxID=2962573 RepID=UPI002882AD88|nr:anti-sigma factor [Nocardioides sp. AE5]MDT0200435.1 anti-sigma factor [Nocardioides sp. AE5]
MSDIHALVGAYAVDALDDIERAQFERHLTGCADCRAEVDSLREASALLAGAVAVAPPPAMRDAVLARISTVRPLPPKRPEERGRRPWFRPLVAAAAAVAVIGGGGALVITQPWAEETTQQLTATQRVLQAPDAEAVELELDGATARLVRSTSHGQAVLVTRDMPAAPAGKVYQLWLQSAEGEMLPAGLMTGGADAEVLLEGDAATATAAGITVEPEGGSPAPTSDPIALFDFSQAT